LDRVATTGLGREGLNALLHLDRESALVDAALVEVRCDEARSQGGSVGALAGVPVVVKDNIATLTLPTSCGSRILEGYVSPFEATVVTRLRAAGAVVVAKSNMDEFAMGSSTENSAFGPTRTARARPRPWRPVGRSAAAVSRGRPDRAGSRPAGPCANPRVRRRGRREADLWTRERFASSRLVARPG
jgi:aspartyl-tRNA(Asn)/glutamyl-tRNA(Gln) amidotransferase subunit A